MIDEELFDLCREYIKSNRISCSADIYQDEEACFKLIEEICDLLGYYDYEEIEEEE